MIATTEYERLRETVGLVDRSQRGKLLLTGAETLEFLQGQVTNDVEALGPGRGCYAALLDGEGIDGELRARDARAGRVEVVQMWGRPESVRREFARRRNQ